MTELEQQLTDELGKPAVQYAQEQKRLAGQVKSFVEGFVKLTEPRQVTRPICCTNRSESLHRSLGL